jgi:hypothetical protein
MGRPRGEPRFPFMISFTAEQMTLIRSAANADGYSPNQWVIQVAVAVAKLTPPIVAPANTPLQQLQANEPKT